MQKHSFSRKRNAKYVKTGSHARHGATNAGGRSSPFTQTRISFAQSMATRRARSPFANAKIDFRKKLSKKVRRI